jgi:cell shape-determining protein MreC
MNYLLAKKTKREKFKKIAYIIIALCFLFYFRINILNGLSSTVYFIFRPVLSLGNNVKGGFSNVDVVLNSKKLLFLENETLKLELKESKATVLNYNSILDENLKLKEILGRTSENKNFILAGILAKPNRSPYDTLIIDVGTKQGVFTGQKVFALGNVPIGEIREVFSDSSKVVLFSSPGEKNEIVISGKDIFMQITGRGGGNFEMILPRDFTIEKGNEVVLPGLTAHTVAMVETILSDPRDSYQKALLRSPVNIQELKFVQVER